MESIRCVIADIPQILLADIIQQITESRPDIEVVRRIDNVEDLPEVVKDHAIDVVILGTKATLMAQRINELLDVSPQVVAVGVVNDGRRVCVCVEDVGVDDLVTLLKDVTRNRNKT